MDDAPPPNPEKRLFREIAHRACFTCQIDLKIGTESPVSNADTMDTIREILDAVSKL